MKKTFGFLSAIALSGTAYADVNVSGYVDAGYGWSNDVAGGTNAFAFNEGGVWFTGESGSSSFVLDIGASATAVAVQQAYVSNKYDSGFSWGLGLWDTQLGSESNDSVNNHFINTGLLSSVLPVTETGLLLGYDLSDMLGLQFWAVNAGTTNDLDNAKFGFKLATKMDGMNARVGAEFASVSGETGYLVDVGADTTFGAIHAGAQFVLAKAAVANADSGIGFGIEAGTELAEAITFDVGFEWANENLGYKVNGVVVPATGMLFRAGPRFAMSEALTLKADWTMTKVEDVDAGQAIELAGIYKF